MGGGRRRELARGLGLVAWPHKWLPNLLHSKVLFQSDTCTSKIPPH